MVRRITRNLLPSGPSNNHRIHHVGVRRRHPRRVVLDRGEHRLGDTPARVARALEEAFVGYGQDPAAALRKSFDEIEGYDEMVALRGVRFESRCEHHLAPIVGRAWVAYVPDGRVVGISKLARVVEIYARRLQLQERLTAQIANVIEQVLKPRGVGVLVRATHHCMTARGVHKPEADLVTSRMIGCLRDHSELRQEFLSMTV